MSQSNGPILLRVIAYLTAKWASLHSWLRSPDVSEMSAIEVAAGLFVGVLLALIVTGTLLLVVIAALTLFL